MFAFLKARPGLDQFHALLGTHGGRWYSACLRITGEAALAEDAVQDALLKAWHRRDEFRGDAELSTWIHRIALNAAIDLMRARRNIANDAHEADDEAAPAHVSPAARYETQAFDRDLFGAMQSLTAMEREAFCLKHIEGWTLEEVARQQGAHVNNTKQALFRAVKKLRVQLAAWREAA